VGRRRTWRKRRRQNTTFFAGKPFFDSARLSLRPRLLPPCGMDGDQLTQVLTWLTYIAAQGTTSPVHTQIRLRAWFVGGSVFATSVDKLLADPQFPGLARALDVRVYALTLKERRRIVVECLPGRTKVRVLGENRQWVQVAYHATYGVMRQQAASVWLLRNIWVGLGSIFLGAIGLVFTVSFVVILGSTHLLTKSAEHVLPFIIAFYAVSLFFMFIALGVIITLPRALVGPDTPWWGPRQRVTAAVSGFAILIIVLGLLVLRNGTTSPNLIAGIVGIATCVITVIPLLNLRTRGGF